jgi:NADH-quinone oxidoreductase subunit J
MLFLDFVFWTLATAGVAAAIGVVLIKDLFRSALLLVVVFLTIAGHFVLLSGEFLGVVQVLIYAGAISILIIFAIMLTSNVEQGNLPNRFQIPAVLLPALLLTALIFVAVDTNWSLTESLPNGAGLVDLAFEDTTFKLAKLLLENYALTFGAAGVLMLASILGALSLVREQ